MNKYLQAAFDHVLGESAKAPETWYVVLLSHESFYGGPEEGGWWGSDTFVQSYAEFTTEKEANEAAEKVRKLAEELTATEKRDHGRMCLREMAWLEVRGLDANYLPEPDGPTEYEVRVCEAVLPTDRRGCRQYS